ncbi:hypothetical protein HMPREF9554_01501 [Treponema phagedenis F0421]|nr:hypothetical protein HMPREF9554_01501 [Treponema phagedenis F0421]
MSFRYICIANADSFTFPLRNNKIHYREKKSRFQGAVLESARFKY